MLVVSLSYELDASIISSMHFEESKEADCSTVKVTTLNWVEIEVSRSKASSNCHGIIVMSLTLIYFHFN